MSIANLKKGDSVILKGFTGIKLGVFQVTAATKKTVTILKKNGDEMIFDRKTGKQTNVEEGKEKYANSIMEDDGSYVAPATRGASKKSAKKTPAKKTPAPVEADEDDDEDDDDDEELDEEPKPTKKTPKKSAAKPAAKKAGKKAAPIVEDEDEDDDEDDDDFEEIDD